MRVAAIDIGTITCRLLIADVTPDGLNTVCRRSAFTNLGIGVDATGMLSDDAIKRTVNQVAEYKSIIDGLGTEGAPVDKVVALATSASRDAGNAAEFVGRLSDLGVELTVIPGEREAGLSFLGAANDFRNKQLLVVDIGGGSTEVISGRANCNKEDLIPTVALDGAHSFNIGARRLAERWLHGDPATANELQEARSWARGVFGDFFKGLPAAEKLIAVAGTATSAVAIRDSLEPYDPNRVHGQYMSQGELHLIFDRLSTMTLEQRKHVCGLQPQRADVIVAGLIVLDTVLYLSGQPGFTVSESDILQGIILDSAATR